MTLLSDKIKKELKEKERIFMQKSCNLIGVVDHLGILEENEVFLQIGNQDTKS
jgi:hypothetical protein